MIDGLAENGFKDGETASITLYNAHNEMATANSIARQITDGSYDLVMSSSTVSLQTVANANKAGLTKHVFGIVADPYVAGVGTRSAEPAGASEAHGWLRPPAAGGRGLPIRPPDVSRPENRGRGVEPRGSELADVHGPGPNGLQGAGHHAPGCPGRKRCRSPGGRSIAYQPGRGSDLGQRRRDRLKRSGEHPAESPPGADSRLFDPAGQRRAAGRCSTTVSTTTRAAGCAASWPPGSSAERIRPRSRSEIAATSYRAASSSIARC